MKIDLIPETDSSNIVSMEEAQAVATKLNAGGCYQCSAKTQENLKEVFDAAINVFHFSSPLSTSLFLKSVLEKIGFSVIILVSFYNTTF